MREGNRRSSRAEILVCRNRLQHFELCPFNISVSPTAEIVVLLPRLLPKLQ